MSDLAEFLLEQIAKDEADARASAADAMVGGRWKHYPRDAYEEVQSLTLAHSKHVLAECEKNRRIVARYGVCAPCYDEGNQIEARTLEWIMRLLALPYADRPGYREEFRP